MARRSALLFTRRDTQKGYQLVLGQALCRKIAVSRICLWVSTCFARRVPIPLALWIGLLLGLLFARSAHGLLARANSSAVSTPAFGIVGTFGLTVYAPITGFSVALAPDWACAYLVDSQRLPAGSETLFVVYAALSVPLGFLWGAAASTRRRWNILTRRIALVAIAFVTTCAALLPLLTVQATYAQYHGDFGIRPISGTDLGYALLWMFTILGLAVTWTLVSLFRMGQQPVKD